MGQHELIGINYYKVYLTVETKTIIILLIILIENF